MKWRKKRKSEEVEQIDDSIRQTLFDNSIWQILTSSQHIFSQVDHTLKNNEPLQRDIGDLVTNIYKGVDGIDLLLQESQGIDEETRREKEQHLNKLKEYAKHIEAFLKASGETQERLMDIPYYTIYIEQLISRLGNNLPINYNDLESIVGENYNNWKKTIPQRKQLHYIV